MNHEEGVIAHLFFMELRQEGLRETFWLLHPAASAAFEFLHSRPLGGQTKCLQPHKNQHPTSEENKMGSMCGEESCYAWRSFSYAFQHRVAEILFLLSHISVKGEIPLLWASRLSLLRKFNLPFLAVAAGFVSISLGWLRSRSSVSWSPGSSGLQIPLSPPTSSAESSLIHRSFWSR